MATEAEITKEAEYQNIMRRGYRIIRPGRNSRCIENKNKGKRGWVKIEKFETSELMVARLIEMGRQDKTVIYND
jgi:hypothetical protein